MASEQERREAQHDALAEISVSLDDEGDFDEVLHELRVIRTLVAARRRHRQPDSR